MRVCNIVLLASSLALDAIATSGLSCSCKAIKASSVFARAGISLPVVGDILVGTSTPTLPRKSPNFFDEDNSFNTSATLSSSLVPVIDILSAATLRTSRFRMPSSTKVLFSKSVSHSNCGSIKERIVISISFTSLRFVCGMSRLSKP